MAMTDAAFGYGVGGPLGAERGYLPPSAPTAAAAPRELTLSERVDGLDGGLVHLGAELELLLSRVMGINLAASSVNQIKSEPTVGLLPAVDRAEGGLRRCHEIVAELQRRL